MYKVFFNQKPLVLTDKILETSDSSPLIFIKYTTASLIIKALKSKNNEKVYLYHKNMDKLWEIFLKKFPVIQAAGGLVERTDGKLLFIFRNDKWDLPKGGVEKKELIIEAAKREVTEETGVADIIIDPGFGFAKTISHNYEILKNLKYFQQLELPILAGISRKSMIYKTLNISAEESLNGTTALNMAALINGGSILRVHDVEEAKQCVQLYNEIYA